MIKIFPFYKGENIANNPLGYTTKANARKRMRMSEVMGDFSKTLPPDYWFEHLFTYQNEEGGKKTRLGIRRAGEEVEVTEYDIKQMVYIRDIEDREVASLLYEMYKWFHKRKPFWERTDEDCEHMRELALTISSKGYYPYCWEDTKDFYSKLSKYVTKNVEFKEIDVDVVLKINGEAEHKEDIQEA